MIVLLYNWLLLISIIAVRDVVSTLSVDEIQRKLWLWGWEVPIVCGYGSYISLPGTDYVSTSLSTARPVTLSQPPNVLLSHGGSRCAV